MTLVRDVLQTNKWQTASMPVSQDRLLCKPDCPTCGGVGFVRYEVPVDDPRFGRILPCPDLPAESSIYANHGLTATEIKSLSWSDVKKRENVLGAVAVLKEILVRGQGMGYLYGGPGLAKTALLKILCAEWVRFKRGLFHFVSLSDILEDLRRAYDDDEPQRALREKEEKYASYPLLCVDELGAERKTDFGIEKFFSLINKRHEAGVERGEKIVTVMAGNISPKELDFRIADRLSDGRNFIVRLTGDSFRPGMDWK